MGESAAQTVREIEDTRRRLESDIRELEDRMPAPGIWAKRLIGVAVGGGIGGTLFWFGVRRIRGRRKAKRRPEGVQAVVQILPENVASRLSASVESGEWKTWAAGLAGAWLVLRLAELRQLRRLNRAVLVGR